MRRLNVKLLIWLAAIAFVLLIGVFFLQRFQVRRNAHILVELAEKAHADGDEFTAVKHLDRYLRFDPTNQEIATKFGLWFTDYVEQNETSFDRYAEAYNTLEGVLRKFPDSEEIRRRLAKFAARLGRVNISIEQYTELLKKNPPDADQLRLEMGQCQEQAGDVELAKLTYTEVVERSPTTLEAYARLARLLRNQLNDAEPADQLIDRMVATNENVAKAYLERARYQQTVLVTTSIPRRQEEIKQRIDEDIEKGLALAPEDDELLIYAGEWAMANNRKGEAREMFERASAASPDEIRPQRLLAVADWNDGRQNEAVEKLKQLFDKEPDQRDVQWFLTDYQVLSRDYDGARETLGKIRALREVNKRLGPEYLLLLDARIAMGEGRVNQAVTMLEDARPALVREAALTVSVDQMLAACYGEMGQPDRMIETYQRALSVDPSAVGPRVGLARAFVSQGRAAEAIDELEQVANRSPEANALLLQLKATAQINRGEQRGVSAAESVEKLVQSYEEDVAAGRRTALELDVLKIDLLYMQDKFDEAQAKAQELLAADPKAPLVWMKLINMTLQKEGNDAAMAVADQALAALPDDLQLRLVRIDVLSRVGADEPKNSQSREELRKALATTEQMPFDDQTAFYDKIGAAFLRLNATEDAKELWRKVVERRDTDPQAHLRFFAVMQDTKDAAGTEAALAGMRDKLGPSSAEYNYAQALRVIFDVRDKQRPVEDLDQAKELVANGMQSRPNWHVLHTAQAEIALLENKIPLAIEHYQQSLALGERSPVHIKALTSLLMQSGRYDDLESVINLWRSVAGESADLDRIVAVFKSRSDSADAALPKAAEVVKDSKRPVDWLFYGQLLMQTSDFEGAENAILKAIEFDPSVPESWIALVGLYAATDRPAKAQESIARAKESIPAELAPLSLARCYELVGNKEEAEQQFQAALAAKPDDLATRRRAADYYLRSSNNEEARKLLQLIVDRASSAGEEYRGDVSWARRQMARVMAIQGGYHEQQQAIDLIGQNANDGVLSYEDLVAKAELLGRRNDARSRREAIETYERAREARKGLLPAQMLALAKLYDKMGTPDDWQRCRAEMLELLGKDNSPQLEAAFVEMLVRHNEIPEAETRANRLAEDDPNSTVTREAKSRVLVAQGKVAEAVDLLEGMLPRPLAPDQTPLLRTLGAYMLGLAPLVPADDAKPLYVAAERMLRDYVAKTPEAELMLANYLGEHGDLNESLDICQKSVDAGKIDMPVQVALSHLRGRRNEVTDAQFRRVEGWVDQLQQSSGNSFVARFLLADLRDVQGKFADSAKLYRELIQETKLTDTERVTALNNLSYFLAVSENNATEAMSLIQQAIELSGPMAELLDTRAMVHIAAGDADKALADVQEAIIEKPDGVKLLHLAIAQLRLNRIDEATSAFREAERLGLTEKVVPPLERKYYVEVKQAVENASAQASQ